jgi:hypothetical protein
LSSPSTSPPSAGNRATPTLAAEASSRPAARNRAGPRPARVVLDNRELVAAQPDQRVALAQRPGQPLGHGHEQRVAHVVAERVVHLLEPVEVDRVQRQRGPRAPRAGEAAAQLVPEEGAVGQPRELVVAGRSAASGVSSWATAASAPT